MADVPMVVKFGTGGLAGVLAWCVVHPFNTLAVRMNLVCHSSAETHSQVPTLPLGVAVKVEDLC